MSKMLLAAVTFLLLGGPFSAHANIIYNWTGDCDGIITPVRGGGSNGCSGQAAMLVVTTDAYIPGELFSGTTFPPEPPVLLHALYADDNIAVDLAFSYQHNGQGFLLPTSLPNSSGAFGGGGGLSLVADFFQSDANGVWKFAGESLRPNCDTGIDFLCGYAARGFNGVWTRVPEPSTLVLLGVGLAGLAFLRRRRES